MTVAKFLVAAVSTVAIILSLGVLPDPASKYAAAVVSIAAAWGVYKVPNKV